MSATGAPKANGKGPGSKAGAKTGGGAAAAAGKKAQQQPATAAAAAGEEATANGNGAGEPGLVQYSLSSKPDRDLYNGEQDGIKAQIAAKQAQLVRPGSWS